MFDYYCVCLSKKRPFPVFANRELQRYSENHSNCLINHEKLADFGIFKKVKKGVVIVSIIYYKGIKLILFVICEKALILNKFFLFKNKILREREEKNV